jgi:hypothetical protein
MPPRCTCRRAPRTRCATTPTFTRRRRRRISRRRTISTFDPIAGRICRRRRRCDALLWLQNALWGAEVPAVLVYEGEVADITARFQGSRYNRKNGVTLDAASYPNSPPTGNFRATSWRWNMPPYHTQYGGEAIVLQKMYQGCTMYQTSLGYELYKIGRLGGVRLAIRALLRQQQVLSLHDSRVARRGRVRRVGERGAQQPLHQSPARNGRRACSRRKARRRRVRLRTWLVSNSWRTAAASRRLSATRRRLAASRTASSIRSSRTAR